MRSLVGTWPWQIKVDLGFESFAESECATMADFSRIVSSGSRVLDFEVHICSWSEGELGLLAHRETDAGRVGSWSRDASRCGGLIPPLDGEGWFSSIDDVASEVLIVSAWSWDVVFLFVLEPDGDLVCCSSCRG